MFRLWMEDIYYPLWLHLQTKSVSSQTNSFWQTLRAVPYRVTDDEPVLVPEILRDQRRNQSAGRAGDDGVISTEVVYLSVDASLQIQVLVHTFLQKVARHAIETLVQTKLYDQYDCNYGMLYGAS